MSAKSIRLCDCKVSELFWIEQENSDFFAKFSLEDTLFGATI